MLSLKNKILVKIQSVRTQLVLFNVIALAILFIALGLIIHYAVKTTIVSSVDHQLIAKTSVMSKFMPPPGPPPDGPHFEWNNPKSISNGHMPWDTKHFDMPPPGHSGKPDHQGKDQPDRPFWEHNPPFQLTDAEFREMLRFRPRRIGLDGGGDPFGPWDKDTFIKSKSSGKLIFKTISYNNQSYRLISQPYPSEKDIQGILQDVYPLSDVERALHDVDSVLLTLLPLALVLAWVAGSFLTGRVLSRIRTMTHAASQIGANDFSGRIPVLGNDEFSHLATTFNSLLSRLEMAIEEQRHLAAQERLLNEQQRRFTADASHELKTPLTIIKGNADIALNGTGSVSAYREALQEIGQAANTMSVLVRDLLLLARADAGKLGQLRIDLLIREILDNAIFASRRQNSAQVVLNLEDAEISVLGNEEELIRLFTNLLSNAIRHTPSDKTIQVDVTKGLDHIYVAIADQGCGIPKEHIPHLGERFYRIDSSRSRNDGGTGLGLSICKSIVDAHNGTIDFMSVVGEGTTVTVILPIGSSLSTP